MIVERNKVEKKKKKGGGCRKQKQLHCIAHFITPEGKTKNERAHVSSVYSLPSKRRGNGLTAQEDFVEVLFSK